MDYYIFQNEKTKGPFTIAQLRAMWSQGVVTANSRYCQEGGKEWLPLRDIVSELEPPPIEPPPNSQATIIRQSVFAGKGCLLQGFGIVCFIIAILTVFSIIGPLIFGSLGIWLLYYGGRESYAHVCSNCRNRVEVASRICPACRAVFTPPDRRISFTDKIFYTAALVTVISILLVVPRQKQHPAEIEETKVAKPAKRSPVKREATSVKLLKWRAAPCVSRDGTPRETVLVDWTNTGTTPVRVVKASIEAYDEKGKLLPSSLDDQKIYEVSREAPGILPGETYHEPDDDGYVMFNWPPEKRASRVEVTINMVYEYPAP